MHTCLQDSWRYLLKMSFPCPGDKFLTSYVNLLLCTDCSFRPSWKWVGGFCDSLVILTPHTVHVHFSISFLCLLQPHPNPLPPELLVVLVPVYKKLIIPLISNLILLMGSIVNLSLTIHPWMKQPVVTETGTIPCVNGYKNNTSEENV